MATKFTVLLRQHPFIRVNEFSIHSPNACDKSTCHDHVVGHTTVVKFTTILRPGRQRLKAVGDIPFDINWKQPRPPTGVWFDLSNWRVIRRSLNPQKSMTFSGCDDEEDNEIELVALNQLGEGDSVLVNQEDENEDEKDGLMIVAEEEFALGKGQSF